MNIFITFGLLIRLVIAVQGELDLTHLKKPSVGAAITNSRVFNFMFGTNPQYRHFEISEFNFPQYIYLKDIEFKNERHFIEFLLRNEWIQRRIGIRMQTSNGLFPDVKGEVFDGTGLPIKVEVEYWAENYKSHGHPFGGCDLILSLFRQPNTKIVRGVPVWSFYVGKKSNTKMKYCLTEDIFGDDNEYDSVSHRTAKANTIDEVYNPQIYDGKKWVRLSTDPILHERYLRGKGLYEGSPLEYKNKKKLFKQI